SGKAPLRGCVVASAIGTRAGVPHSDLDSLRGYSMTTARNLTALLVALILACALAPAARADSQAGPYATQRTAAVDPDHTVESDYRPVDTYSMEEIIDAG